MAVRVLVVERGAVVGQNLGSNVALAVPPEQLDVGPGLALAAEHKGRRAVADQLDRVADVYPEMDYTPMHKMGFQHSQGGRGTGRIEGCIWETNAKDFARAYALLPAIYLALLALKRRLGRSTPLSKSTATR